LVTLRIERPVARAANVTGRPRSHVTAVHETRRVEALTIRDSSTGTDETLPTAAPFILIGAEPHASWLANVIERDDHGFVVTGRDLRDRKPPSN
jgi:thioredoxin reductase (NADPH)